ncbi:MAG: hypothetical protein M1815_000589 [Lichina confinis]|nr:MAG: hypothetical protein M1815_000589 [Lichina confinis]
MGKTGRASKRKEKSVLHRSTVTFNASDHSTYKPVVTPETLLARATALLQTSQPDEAAVLGERALAALQRSGSGPLALLPVLALLGEAYVALGDVDEARSYFLRASEADPDGLTSEDAGGGAEKFLWLAQLCEEGGRASLDWYERGIQALRKQIHDLETRIPRPDTQSIEDRKDKLAKALCGVAELYMTDLSWEDEAESKCEMVIDEALTACPDSPESLQTLASIRISQTRINDAKIALKKSMNTWKDLLPEDSKVPDFPTRISLARLLLETEMYEVALKVLERLITDDDQSVEAWYLGGWTMYLIGQKAREATTQGRDGLAADESAHWKALWTSSRDWLENTLKLYELLQYEDERLGDHALELVQELREVVGTQDNEGDAAQDEGEWQDEDDTGASDEDDDDEDDDGDDDGDEMMSGT